MATHCPRTKLPRIIKDKTKYWRFGIWNVRSLYQIGKLANVIAEIKKLNFTQLGLGKIVAQDITIIYSGETKMKRE